MSDREGLVQRLAKHDGVFADDARNTLDALEDEGYVTIPRAQLEAYKAAAEAASALERDVKRDANPSGWFKAMADMFEKLAALRAAGIDPSEEK